MYYKFASEVLYLAKQVGEEVMKYYNKDDLNIVQKEDSSPLTEADLLANKLIIEGLKDIDKNIPIMSEENTKESNLEVAKNNRYWIIDPIDGTKSFIKHSDEFTVNIAMIEDNFPVGGVVYAPAMSKAYFTAEDGNSYFQYGNNLPDSISVGSLPEEGPVVVVSKSHITKETEEYVNKLGKVSNYISIGSSLKFCLLAQGVAHLYPRLSRTMEWDTAAGQAVLEAAGGSVKDIKGNRLKYGKKDYANDFFVANVV